ncbi:MAG: heparinase II/III family protein, partial [Planctomycetota bacterium]
MTDTAKSTADRIRDAAVANHRALTEARGESPADALADGLPRLAWTDAMQEKAALALRNGAPADAPRDRRGIDDWATSRHESRFQFERYRFIILSQLAAGYQNTGEEVYARAARDYIEEHLNTYSTPPYDDTLNLSIRLCQHGRQGWIGTLPHFLGSDAYDDAFVDRVVAATREQVAYLKERYPRHGNTRLFGINCTLWCGLCLPFLPEAEGWRTLGARLFNDAFHREINPDGSNLERDPHYLGMYVQNFSESLIWARAFPDLGLRVSVEPVARMWDFAACSRKPSGHECGLHDGTTDWQGRAGGTQDGAVDRHGAAPCDIFRRRMAFRRLHG